MSAIAVCSQQFGNLGSACVSGNTLAPAVGIIITTDDFQFDTNADFADLTKYDDAIKAKTMFPLMNLMETTDNTEEAVYQTTSLGKKIPLRDGFYSFLYDFLLSLEVTKELNKFDNSKVRYFVVDDRNQIRGYSPDGIVVKGYSISNFNVEKMKPATADGAAYTPISILEQNPTQLNSFGVIIQPLWEAESLKSLTNVDIKVVGVPTATEVVVSINYKAGINGDGTDKLIPINGFLDKGDYKMRTEIGGIQAVDAVVTAGDGLYTLSGIGWVTGTIDLESPTLIVTPNALYESTGSAVVTI